MDTTFNGKTQELAIEERMESRDKQLELDENTIEGCPNIYTDAAWKCSVSPSNTVTLHKEKAGIGIYIDWKEGDHKAIYVQAASDANSQAEAQAMELAAKIGRSLQVQKPNFLTDNLILAQALQRKDPATYPGHWIIRPNLHQFFHHT
jgi:formamidopyrimidine-DNA glycosylase